jgi:hypothetical protein
MWKNTVWSPPSACPYLKQVMSAWRSKSENFDQEVWWLRASIHIQRRRYTRYLRKIDSRVHYAWVAKYTLHSIPTRTPSASSQLMHSELGNQSFADIECNDAFVCVLMPAIIILPGRNFRFCFFMRTWPASSKDTQMVEIRQCFFTLRVQTAKKIRFFYVRFSTPQN